MPLPKHLQAMSEEEIISDQSNFATALDMVPQLKVARTEKNHADARSWICLRYGWATNAVYTPDSYSVYISANHDAMDHIPDPIIEKYRDDPSGDRRHNPDVRDQSSVDPYELQELRSAKRDLEALELELRYDPPRGKSDPRVVRRDALLKKLDDSPFFNQDGGDQDRKKSKFLQKKTSEAIPLDIDTPDSALQKASAEQIKDLLRRRRERVTTGGGS
jgi:hypothetical protein